jgi:glycine cleavage system H protein
MEVKSEVALLPNWRAPSMSFEYPEDLRYLDSHEYIKLEGDVATVGITMFAVDQLGDIVFVEIPAEGQQVTKGESFGTIESVKAVEELYAPVTGTVIAANTAIVDAPEQLTNDPYEAGWLLKIRISDSAELDSTLSAIEYREQIEGH